MYMYVRCYPFRCATCMYSMCVQLSGSLAYRDIFVENGCVRLSEVRLYSVYFCLTITLEISCNKATLPVCYSTFNIPIQIQVIEEEAGG